MASHIALTKSASRAHSATNVQPALSANVPGMARFTPQLARVQSYAPHPGMSSGKFAERPFDMMRFKAVFPHRWAEFLRAHFQSSTHVAVFFGCDDRTARHWLDGTTAPSGPVAMFAAARIDGAIQFMMDDAA